MAKSSADRQREYRARNVTESPGSVTKCNENVTVSAGYRNGTALGVTECNGNVTPDVTDFGGPDCQCGHCRQLDEAGIDGNRVSVPGDADYVTLTGRTQGEAGGQ